jgi:hypothetical protein
MCMHTRCCLFRVWLLADIPCGPNPITPTPDLHSPTSPTHLLLGAAPAPPPEVLIPAAAGPVRSRGPAACPCSRTSGLAAVVETYVWHQCQQSNCVAHAQGYCTAPDKPASLQSFCCVLTCR